MKSKPAEKPTINKTLAENLDALMKDKEFVQSKLAALSGLGQTTISLYLHPENRKLGKTGKPASAKLAEVEALAKALNVEVWELLRPLTSAQRELFRGVDALIAAQSTPENKAPYTSRTLHEPYHQTIQQKNIKKRGA